MSTKSSLAYGEHFHLYHDMMEGEDDVFLELRGNVEFEAYKNEVTVRIPVHVWEHIRHRGGFTPHYAAMDDEALLAHVTKQVDERIKDWEDSNRSGLMAFFGSAVYGSAEDAREDQIKHGFEYLSWRRAKEREIVANIQALNDAHTKTYDTGLFVVKVGPDDER